MWYTILRRSFQDKGEGIVRIVGTVIKVILILIGLGALFIAVHIPVAEYALYHFRHQNMVIVFLLACAISGAQGVGEYFWTGEAGRLASSWAQAIRTAFIGWVLTSPAVQRFREQVPESMSAVLRQIRSLGGQVRSVWCDLKCRLKPTFKPSGYGAVFLSAFVSRLASIAIWRASKLKGAIWFIVGFTLVRLFLVAVVAQSLR